MPEALWRTLDGDESERILGRAKVRDLTWNVKVVLEIVYADYGFDGRLSGM
jgi:hypothetical protein